MAHLNEKAVKQIEEIIAKYQDERTPLMMILSEVQREFGYIPLEVQELISDKTGIPVSEKFLINYNKEEILENLSFEDM